MARKKRYQINFDGGSGDHYNIVSLSLSKREYKFLEKLQKALRDNETNVDYWCSIDFTWKELKY